MKNYSTYFFFDGANKELAKVILEEAKNNGCKISQRQYSGRGEATIITAKTWHIDISMRAWKRIIEQKRR